MREGWWSITTLSEADLIPLICGQCGIALRADDEAALFVCTNCGLVHELWEGALRALSPLVATSTTQLPVTSPPQYLAVWRLAVLAQDRSAPSAGGPLAPSDPQQLILWVPAFSLAQSVIRQLGGRLSRRQPVLVPAAGGVGAPAGAPISPNLLSSVVLSRNDARILADFVYLALRTHEDRTMTAAEYQLKVLGEELLYLPALPDPRCVHDASWRLLFREFDDQLG